MTTVATLLRECARSKDLARGRRLHGAILGSGHCSTVLENLVVWMYGECGSLDEAVDAFGRISCPNVFSWNILVSAFALRGHLDMARALLEAMPEFDTVSLNVVVAAYARSGFLAEAEALFRRIPEKDLVSWNTLLTGFASNGYRLDAKNAFDVMPRRNLVSWNAMLIGGGGSRFLEGNIGQELRELFEKMPQRCIVSWTAMVTAYARHGYLQSSWNLFLKNPEGSLVASNSVMQAFAQTGCSRGTVKAIFEKLPERDLASYNVMLSVAEELSEAISLLDSMPQKNFGSWTSALSALSIDNKKIYESAELIFLRMPQWDAFSCNVLAGVYSDAGDLISSKRVFDTNLQKDVVSWNAMINAYARQGDSKRTRDIFSRMPLHTLASFTAMLLVLSRINDDVQEVRDWFESMPEHDAVAWNTVLSGMARTKESLQLFRRMQLEGMRPTYVTYASILDSCAAAAALSEGRAIHSRVAHLGFFPRFDAIGNALINFYSKCGLVKDASAVFQGMEQRDVITWSTMVAGFAWNGLGQRAAQVFQLMLLQGKDPNAVTLVNVLASCSHGGLLNFGRSLFVFVTTEVPGFVACCEHYDCMVDLLARAGRLEDAMELMDTMPFETTFTGRMSYIASCSRQCF